MAQIGQRGHFSANCGRSWPTFGQGVSRLADFRPRLAEFGQVSAPGSNLFDNFGAQLLDNPGARRSRRGKLSETCVGQRFRNFRETSATARRPSTDEAATWHSRLRDAGEALAPSGQALWHSRLRPGGGQQTRQSHGNRKCGRPSTDDAVAPRGQALRLISVLAETDEAVNRQGPVDDPTELLAPHRTTT